MQPCNRRQWTCPFTLEQCLFFIPRFARCTHTLVSPFMNDNVLTKVSISRIETDKGREIGRTTGRNKNGQKEKKGKRKKKKGTTMKHVSRVNALSAFNRIDLSQKFGDAMWNVSLWIVQCMQEGKGHFSLHHSCLPQKPEEECT